MSNELKCPFCQQELLLSSFRDGDKDNEIWNCLHCQIGGKRKLWQELIRTRKALDKAKNGLKELKDIIACPPDISYETCVSMYADGVLQEIKELEQKD